MLSLRLLGVAAQAEGIRLRSMSGVAARGAMLGVAAGAAGVVSLGFLHVAGWLWLAEAHGPLGAALGMAAADGLFALLLLLAGARAQRRPNAVANEALALRQRAMEGLAELSPVAEATRLLPWRHAIFALGGLALEHLSRRRPPAG